jgi:class 3 adenylate cyclase
LEFTVIGNDVNRTSRFCDSAAGGDVVLSPQMYERVSGTVTAEQMAFETKHEGIWQAWRITAVKPAP